MFAQKSNPKSTRKYVKQYHLDTNIGPISEEQITQISEDLGKEFQNRFLINELAQRTRGIEFTYKKFLHLVNEIHDKFQGLCNKKAGEALPEKIFARTFALFISPLREQYFPSEHKLALDKRIASTAQSEKDKLRSAKERVEKQKKKKLEKSMESKG